MTRGKKIQEQFRFLEQVLVAPCLFLA